MSASAKKPVEIMLVEDDPEDIALVRQALEEGRVPSRVTLAKDGVEALELLKKGKQTKSLPDLILLDLKMPKKGGFEVLAEIKSDVQLRRIPAIILTTSEAPEDILRAYDLQASCYVNKPSDLETFDQMINAFQDFCLTVVKLPPRGPD
jgi:CheY-like chemotaxis protein